MREDQEKRRFARPEGNASPYDLRNFVHDGRGTVGKERAIKINSRQGQENRTENEFSFAFFFGLTKWRPRCADCLQTRTRRCALLLTFGTRM